MLNKSEKDNNVIIKLQELSKETARTLVQWLQSLNNEDRKRFIFHITLNTTSINENLIRNM